MNEFEDMNRREDSYLIEFSGEHPSLPLDEFKSAAKGENLELQILSGKGRLFRVKLRNAGKVFSRLGMVNSLSFSCSEPLADYDKQTLVEKGEKIEKIIRTKLHGIKTFGITCKKLNGNYPEIDSQRIIRYIAEPISLKVSLTSPDLEILLFFTPELNIGIKLVSKNRKRLRERAGRYREFFSPVSLHPILARAVINLSRAPVDGTLLDPFCGTGGILIEAADMGMEVIGSDRNDEMLQGAKINLGNYGKKTKLINCDISDVKRKLLKLGLKKVDSIATDLPYARASTTFGEELADLRKRAMKTFRELLKPGGHAAVINFDKSLLENNWGPLKLISCHKLKVHASLTRYISVFRKH